MLHEMTHEAFSSEDGFDLDGNGIKTDSEASIYGRERSEELARNYPSLAQNHADSYSFYAYNR